MRYVACMLCSGVGGNKANDTRTGLLINIGSENCNERIINGVIRKCTFRKCTSARYKICSTTYICSCIISPPAMHCIPTRSVLQPVFPEHLHPAQLRSTPEHSFKPDSPIVPPRECPVDIRGSPLLRDRRVRAPRPARPVPGPAPDRGSWCLRWRLTVGTRRCSTPPF